MSKTRLEQLQSPSSSPPRALAVATPCGKLHGAVFTEGVNIDYALAPLDVIPGFSVGKGELKAGLKGAAFALEHVDDVARAGRALTHTQEATKWLDTVAHHLHTFEETPFRSHLSPGLLAQEGINGAHAGHFVANEPGS